jgi:ElaA protein
MISWQCKTFNELTNRQLYQILKLRSEVFVVEQNCVFLDMDNEKDFMSYHLFATENDQLLAYSRLLPSGLSFEKASIGRVVTSPQARGRKLGVELLHKGIAKIYEIWGQQPIEIGAQLYLQKFYESFGFEQSSPVYLEDGIAHIEMIKPLSK